MNKRKKDKTDIVDNRKVAIYARKSVITHKGDSVNNQEKYCMDYSKFHLNLPDDYDFEKYHDNGESGFYSDRDEFQRLMKAVERGEIKAIACYKLDRMARKLSDICNMLEFLKKHDTALLVCSNGINTRDESSKLLLQMLGMIAEFERDVLTERIEDNMAELAKDGRWLGGVTPTGFTTERITYGTGKNKTAITNLVTVPEEKNVVLKVFEIFLATRSLHTTATYLNNEGYKTKNGADFTTLAVKDIIRNPVYCVADERSYSYFFDLGGNLYGEQDTYDGFHGLSVYKRTEQTKEETDESTLLNPEYKKYTKQNDIDEWVIAVGKHEGFIDSKRWIEAQNIREGIAEKYNRPHRATNALLSGIIYCPLCNEKLVVIPESNRFTNGKPRFKYACKNAVRKGKCQYKAVRGVEMDEFIVDKLISLSEGEEENYIGNLQANIDKIVFENGHAKEISELKKDIKRTEDSIASQIKNMRHADENVREYYQNDISEMGKSLTKMKMELEELMALSDDGKEQIKEFEAIKTLIMSFKDFLKVSDTDEQVKYIHDVVERIYVVRDGKKEECNIYIKGCKEGEYSGFFESHDSSGIAESETCDSEGGRELYSHICRSAAKSRV